MKKIILFAIAITIFSTGISFAAKYTINTSGTVKTNGQVVTPTKQPANPSNVYTPSTYNANSQVAQAGIPVINLVMDYSGSMVNWIERAKAVMSYIIAKIPASTQVGLRVFGQDNYSSNALNLTGTVKKITKENNGYKVTASCNPAGTGKGACSATQQVTKITRANANLLISGMNSARIGSSTPMVLGLDRAIYQDLAGFDTTTTKKIILITDGGENCGGDPCAFARELVAKRTDVHIDVILVGSRSANLACLTKTTGGTLYNINNLSSLQTVLTKSMTTKPKEIGNTPSDSNSAPTNYEYYKD
ncbi:MAG: hypothetical protein MJ229_03580 [bacterium]|nr:hypothetical protein [bacterium]